MAKSIEFRGRTLFIGDILHNVWGGRDLRVRGFHDAVPVVSQLSADESRDARLLVDQIIPLLLDEGMLRAEVDQEMQQIGSQDEHAGYESLMRRTFHSEAERLKIENREAVVQDVLDGVFTMSGKAKATFSSSEFIGDGLVKTREGISAMKRCPFSGVAKILAPATYAVLYGKKKQ